MKTDHLKKKWKKGGRPFQNARGVVPEMKDYIYHMNEYFDSTCTKLAKSYLITDWEQGLFSFISISKSNIKS